MEQCVGEDLTLKSCQETFPDMWQKIVDLLCDSERGDWDILG